MQDIIKKFKFKDSGIILSAPADIETEFKKIGFKTSFDNTQKSTNTLVFINDNKEYLDFLNKNLRKIALDSILWFAYPKRSSKVKTDINRDTIRLTGEKYGITTVTAISINDIWSALRFRPIDKVGK
ncbi:MULTISPECIES: hypothetical protein [Chitinophagaceae]